MSYVMSSTHIRAIWPWPLIHERDAQPVGIMKLVCKGCGLIFTATRRDARFCSNACRQRAFVGEPHSAEPARSLMATANQTPCAGF
jgi:hypothetical protein